jgi:N-acetylated-alpha-linked acidic dipeptidase
VKNASGDPTTPDSPSLPDAVRIAPGDAEMPSIPVVPVSADIAAAILSRLEGARLPQDDWQGALPFRYHLGPGPAAVRLTVDDDRDATAAGFREVTNVVARIEGTDRPDEWVIVGGHIDAWGPGANDNVSGTASVLAAARAVRALADAGFPPRRTIVFAGWDGEEWGLIGSTEWVEEHAQTLSAGAVAYLNQDMIAGPNFGAGASPSLKSLIRAAAAVVPLGDGTLRDAWADGDSALAIGDLGGGSDHAGFYDHLGIPSAGHGFGGPYGLYHSAYDTREAVEIVDPGYRNQAASSELVAILALRLANAEMRSGSPMRRSIPTTMRRSRGRCGISGTRSEGRSHRGREGRPPPKGWTPRWTPSPPPRNASRPPGRSTSGERSTRIARTAPTRS